VRLPYKRAARLCATLTGWFLFDYAFVLAMDHWGDSEFFAEGGIAAEFLLLCFLAINILIPIVLIYIRHKRRAKWIEEEAEEWLANRFATPIPRTNAWPRQVRRHMLWIPSLIALAVFLFEPETAGIVSHLFYGRSVALDHYRFQFPLTSWITYSGGNGVVAILEPGIARVGPISYWQKGPPISSLSIHLIYNSIDGNSRRPSDSEKIVSRRTIPFGKETLTCWDIFPSRYLRSSLPNVDIADITCLASTNDFVMYFAGRRIDASIFYEILEKAKETQ